MSRVVHRYLSQGMVIAAGLLALSACQTLPASTATNAQTSVQPQVKKAYQTFVTPGQAFVAPQWQDVHGRDVQLQPEQKKLLVYFATWCSDSRRTLKELMASPLVTDQHWQIIAIGREETVASLTPFIAEFGLPFTVVADPERKYYQQVADAGIPRLIVLSEDNSVQQTLIGEQAGIIGNIQL